MKIEDLNRIIEMAWEDRTPFEAVEKQFGLSEKKVIALMRKNLLQKSFKMWRRRMKGRTTKHASLRCFKLGRLMSSRQRIVSSNKIT